MIVTEEIQEINGTLRERENVLQLLALFKELKRVFSQWHLFALTYVAQKLEILSTDYSFNLFDFILYSENLSWDLMLLKRFGLILDTHTEKCLAITSRGEEVASLQNYEMNRVILKQLAKVKPLDLENLAKVIMLSERFNHKIASTKTKKGVDKLFLMNKSTYMKSVNLYRQLTSSDKEK